MSIKLPNKKYNVIVIDPPWTIKKVPRSARPNQIKMDYPLMRLDEIKKMNVGDLAEDDCWIFLWATQKYLFDAKDVLEGWGFKYLVMSVWQKTYGVSAGMPLYGFQWNAEFILVGYKNKPKIYPKRKLIPLVFQAENIKHSKKPDKFYEMVEVLGEKRIDIFAREERNGWDVWGNEI
jgi:N6-adenosine-specific RNA methylase IME4